MSAPSFHNFDDRVGNDGVTRRARRRPGENRERLLDAGISAFSIHGYHGASTASIAALAGVPQPHVYANFRTKQELFLECARRVSEDLARGPHDGSRLVASTDVQASFLMQCLAAFQEEPLQPELRDVILTLTNAVGADAVLALISEGAKAALSES